MVVSGAKRGRQLGFPTANLALPPNQALPAAFHAYDLAECVVTEMSELEAADSVLGYYVPPATDGSRPGMHCINTHDPRRRPRFEYEGHVRAVGPKLRGECQRKRPAASEDDGVSGQHTLRLDQ